MQQVLSISVSPSCHLSLNPLSPGAPIVGRATWGGPGRRNLAPPICKEPCGQQLQLEALRQEGQEAGTCGGAGTPSPPRCALPAREPPPGPWTPVHSLHMGPQFREDGLSLPTACCSILEWYVSPGHRCLFSETLVDTPTHPARQLNSKPGGSGRNRFGNAAATGPNALRLAVSRKLLSRPPTAPSLSLSRGASELHPAIHNLAQILTPSQQVPPTSYVDKSIEFFPGPLGSAPASRGHLFLLPPPIFLGCRVGPSSSRPGVLKPNRTQPPHSAS